MPDQPEVSEYKGNKLLCLNPEAPYKFSFGIGKAKMILQHLHAIKIFVDTNGESCSEPDDLLLPNEENL